jgi:hypothetical protein
MKVNSLSVSCLSFWTYCTTLTTRRFQALWVLLRNPCWIFIQFIILKLTDWNSVQDHHLMCQTKQCDVISSRCHFFLRKLLGRNISFRNLSLLQQLANIKLLRGSGINVTHVSCFRSASSFISWHRGWRRLWTYTNINYNNYMWVTGGGREYPEWKNK